MFHADWLQHHDSNLLLIFTGQYDTILINMQRLLLNAILHHIFTSSHLTIKYLLAKSKHNLPKETFPGWKVCALEEGVF